MIVEGTNKLGAKRAFPRPKDLEQKKGCVMKTDFLTMIDWNRGIWIVQHRDLMGNMITESTDFPASTPSIVVCDRLLRDRPGSRIFAKV